MHWTPILQASLSTIAEVSPAVLQQHWNGNGPDGKINNAIQILKDAALAGTTIEQNLAKSGAAQNPHPEIAATAANLADAGASYGHRLVDPAIGGDREDLVGEGRDR
jgi:Neuraminidase (sialidase)